MHCLEDACCLVTLESGVLAAAAKGPLTLESGVLAVLAKGRLAPLVALTDFNFPRTFWRGCECCWSPNSAESMARVRAGDTGGDWETNSSQTLPNKPSALANAGHDN